MNLFPLVSIVALNVVGAPPAEENTAPQQVKVIEQFIAAFNNHDAAAMMAYVSDDVLWMSVADDKVSVETRGRDALQTAMSAYFRSTANVRSVTEDHVISGDVVSLRERVFWGPENRQSNQQALAVYHVRNNKIHRVWYFWAAP